MASQNNVNEEYIFRFIKWGGASITEKDKFETVNWNVLNKLCDQLAQIYFQAPKSKIILCHGAGSFGHFQAKKYSLHQMKPNEQYSRIGFSETRQSVKSLQNIVVNELLKRRVPAFGISPFPDWKTVNREKIISDGLNIISTLLIQGFVPVLHGDVVFDSEVGCNILSGDTIIKNLACNLSFFLPPRIKEENHLYMAYVAFITNVDGIFTYPPELPQAQLIRELQINPLNKDLIFPEMNQLETDVTGGIRTKIKEAIDIVLSGINVIIAKGGSENAALQAMSGKIPEIGTFIHS